MKKVLAIILIGIAVSLVPSSFAQELSGGEAARQRIEAVISSEGDVHVTHIVQKSQTQRQINFLNGTVSNLQVTDDKGGKPPYLQLGEDVMVIMPSNSNTIVEYDLDGVLRHENNFWVWEVLYPGQVAVILPQEVDLVYANGRPVLLGDKEGVMCHGCQIKIEYSIGIPEILHEISWEDKKFLVEIRTFAKISNFVFDQPAKTVSFDVDSKDEFVNVIMPLELLWGPYEVFDGNDKRVFLHDYINNGTHIWLNMKANADTGNIRIIGTTVIPEFPLAIVILSVSILAIIPLSRKFNLR